MASLTDNARGVIYDHKMFIVQATETFAVNLCLCLSKPVCLGKYLDQTLLMYISLNEDYCKVLLPFNCQPKAVFTLAKCSTKTQTKLPVLVP